LSTDTIVDSILTFRLRNGSLEAFEKLYHRYKNKLYLFSLKYLDDNVDAEETVQIVFISLWENRNNLDEKRSVKSFLYKATVNHVYNIFKKRAVHLRYVNQELLKPEKSVNQTYEQIYTTELEKKIEIIIKTLPEKQQRIMNLSRFDGFTNEEIAKKLDLSIRTVENQLFRATKILKEHLKEEIIS
jgi:RNA polymerase sigma-70 factor (ECF subfamily)